MIAAIQHELRHWIYKRLFAAEETAPFDSELLTWIPNAKEATNERTSNVLVLSGKS